MTTFSGSLMACSLFVAMSLAACSPPTPKVERAGSSAGLEQRPPAPAAHSEGSLDR